MTQTLMPSRPGLFHLFLKATGYPIFGFPPFVVLVGLWCISSAVLHDESVCVCVKMNMAEIVVFTVLAMCLYVTL